jgi:hypothetical protein
MTRFLLLTASVLLALASLARADIPVRPGESLTVVLSGAKTTTEPTWRVRFRTGTAALQDEALGSTNGATAVTVLTVPSTQGPNETRTATGVYIYNGDTAAATVTVNKISAGTTYALGSVTLAVGDTLTYDGNGFSLTDNSGQKKTTSAIAGVANVTSQIYISRGGSKVPVTGMTVASLGTTQNSTPTAAQLLNGIVTQTGATGAGTVTLPTGTLLSGAMTQTPSVGDTFVCLFANLGGGQTLTITGATGSTVKGTAAVGSAKNAWLLFENTGANTWDVYVIVSA